MKALLTGALALGLSVLGTLAMHAAPGEPAAAPADAILAANRAAVGDPPPRSALTLVYRDDSSGLTGTLTDRVDVATGAYVEKKETNGMTEGGGFDGKTLWQLDIPDTYTPQQGGDQIPTAIDSAYRRANLWWRTDHGGAVVVYLGPETDSGAHSSIWR
jgi:hypothetical protein